MSLVYRNGRPYLYRSIRRGGRVTSEYVASGEIALLMAQLDVIERDEKDDEAKRTSEKGRKAEEIERSLEDHCERCRSLTDAALAEAGYHRHHRGEWRKRRDDRGR